VGAIGQLFGWIATPIYYAISGVLLVWHKIFGAVLGDGNGWSWVLAIIGLTITIRALLIPLFVKQIKSSRNMQLLQPKVKELQKKYGHDRERLAQETMALYKETGTNPFASCLPLIVQAPIFLCLFRIVNDSAHGDAKGFMTTADVTHLANAKLFGAQLHEAFKHSDGTAPKVIAAVLVVAMVSTTFLTQRQLMSKNMPADAMTGQFAQQQKIMLYVLPLIFVFSGFNFPIAAMLYWTSSNFWTMGQQYYVIRNNPSPGTPAFEEKLARDRAKAQRKGVPMVSTDADGVTIVDGEVAVEPVRPTQRQQPKRQTKAQRQKGPSAQQGGKQTPPTVTKPGNGPDAKDKNAS
jgi:YidC/Oxa1 family membrane protein insertase